MLKFYFSLILVALCIASCTKDATETVKPVKQVITQPIQVEIKPTTAFIAVVDAAGDTLRTDMVSIIDN